MNEYLTQERNAADVVAKEETMVAYWLVYHPMVAYWLVYHPMVAYWLVYHPMSAADRFF